MRKDLITLTGLTSLLVPLVAFGAIGMASTAQAAEAFCDGRPATIVVMAVPGSDKTNPLVGTPGNDVIVGTPLQDTIDGAAGDDMICGSTTPISSPADPATTASSVASTWTTSTQTSIGATSWCQGPVTITSTSALTRTQIRGVTAMPL